MLLNSNNNNNGLLQVSRSQQQKTVLNDPDLLKQRARRLEKEIRHCFSELFLWPNALMAENYRIIYKSANQARQTADVRKKVKQALEEQREVELCARGEGEVELTLPPPTAAERVMLESAEQALASTQATTIATSSVSKSITSDAVPLWQRRQLPELRINPYTRPDRDCGQKLG